MNGTKTRRGFMSKNSNHREEPEMFMLSDQTDFHSQAQRILSQHRKEQWSIVSIRILHCFLYRELYGYEAAEDLLSKVEEKLGRIAEEAGGLAVFVGQDAFAMLVPKDYLNYLDRQSAFENLVQDEARASNVEFSVGACKVTAEDNLRLIYNHAVFIADDQSIAGHCVPRYEDDAAEWISQNTRMGEDLEKAFKTGEFEVYYQPICNLKNGRIVASEALIRWHHPKRGLLTADSFIWHILRCGLTNELNSFVLNSVMKNMADFIAQGHQPIPVTVNLSLRGTTPDRICRLIEELTSKYSINPSLLGVEINGTSYTSNKGDAQKTAVRLRKAGHFIVINDFIGSAASFEILKDQKIDAIRFKMDFLTVHGIGKERGYTITETLIRLAHSLGISVIAEGTETYDQVDFLLDIDCHYGQGFFYSRPLSAVHFEDLIRNNRMIDSRGLISEIRPYTNIKQFLTSDYMTDSRVNNILGPFAVIDLVGSTLVLADANEQFIRLIGCNSTDMRTVERFIRERSSSFDNQKLLDAMTAARDNPNATQTVEMTQVRRSGQQRSFLCSMYYLTEDTTHLRVCLKLEETTEQKKQRLELSLAQKQQIILMAHAQMQMWEYDPLKKTTVIRGFEPGCLADEIGLEEKSTGLMEGFLKIHRLSKESRTKLKNLFRNSIYGVGHHLSEQILIEKDGLNEDERWIELTVENILDEGNRLARIIGGIRDITANKLIEKKNRDADGLLRMFEERSVAHWKVNLTHNKILMLQSTEGKRQRQITYEGSYDKFIEDEIEKYVDPNKIDSVKKFLNRGRLIKNFNGGTVHLKHEYKRWLGGKLRWVEMTCYMLPNTENRDLIGYFYLSDIDDEKMQKLELKERAEKDSLTGLYNRKGTIGRVEALLTQLKIRKISSAMIIMDIDYFKTINDTNGHMFGDAVLTRLAASLRSFFREDDIICRLGGDEFLVFCPHMDFMSLQVKSGQLNTYLTKAFEGFGDNFCLTVSAGAALAPLNGQRFEQLYQKADKALYQAKEEGRNRFRVYDSSMDADKHDEQHKISHKNEEDAPLPEDTVLELLSSSIDFRADLSMAVELISGKYDDCSLYYFEQNENDYKLLRQWQAPKMSHTMLGRSGLMDFIYTLKNSMAVSDQEIYSGTTESLKKNGFDATNLIDSYLAVPFSWREGRNELLVAIWTRPTINTGNMRLFFNIVQSCAHALTERTTRMTDFMKITGIFDELHKVIFNIDAKGNILYANRCTASKFHGVVPGASVFKTIGTCSEAYSVICSVIEDESVESASFSGIDFIIRSFNWTDGELTRLFIQV